MTVSSEHWVSSCMRKEEKEEENKRKHSKQGHKEGVGDGVTVNTKRE